MEGHNVFCNPGGAGDAGGEDEDAADERACRFGERADSCSDHNWVFDRSQFDTLSP